MEEGHDGLALYRRFDGDSIDGFHLNVYQVFVPLCLGIGIGVVLL